MNAITIGSTGAVGRDLLTVLASDPVYERVDVLFSSLGTSKKQAGSNGASITTTSSPPRKPHARTACRRWSSSRPSGQILHRRFSTSA